jgi:hypothetical protein
MRGAIEMRKIIMWIVQGFANVVCFGWVCILAYTWFAAWFNGGSIIINIDNYGEATPELFMWFMVTPFIVYGAYLNMRDFTKHVLDYREYIFKRKKEWL